MRKGGEGSLPGGGRKRRRVELSKSLAEKKGKNPYLLHVEKKKVLLQMQTNIIRLAKGKKGKGKRFLHFYKLIGQKGKKRQQKKKR